MARLRSILFPKYGVSNFLANRDDGRNENSKLFWMYCAIFRIPQNCIKSSSSQTGMNTCIRALSTTGSFLRSKVLFRQNVPCVLCNPRVHRYQTAWPEPVKFTPHLSTLFLWYILLLIPFNNMSSKWSLRFSLSYSHFKYTSLLPCKPSAGQFLCTCYDYHNNKQKQQHLKISVYIHSDDQSANVVFVMITWRQNCRVVIKHTMW